MKIMLVFLLNLCCNSFVLKEQEIGIMMQLEQDLLNRGYKQSIEPHWKSSKMTDVLFQKRICDGKGTKYFINVWYYPAGRYGYTDLPESIQAECQFHSDGVTEETMDIQLFTKDIDKIEEVFENIWNKLELGSFRLSEED